MTACGSSPSLRQTTRAVERRSRCATWAPTVSLQTSKPPESSGPRSRRTLRIGERAARSRRFWQRDASLWTGTDEAKWMGWLDITAPAGRTATALPDFAADDVKMEKASPHVAAARDGRIEPVPRSAGDDTSARSRASRDCTCSTRPTRRRSARIERKVDLRSTLFIVSSKSGTTLEPNIFKQYFFERVKQAVGADKAGSRFIAITDPGSKMQQVAERDRFRHIFAGVPSIGGRYSALSNFGMVPAAVMGLDVGRVLDARRADGRRLRAERACRARTPASCWA